MFPTLRLFVASGGAFRCCTRFAWSVQEKLPRTVRMAGLMAYTLTEDRGVDLPDTGAWRLVRTKDAKRQRVCIPVLGVVARVFSLASRVASCLLWASYAFYAVCTFDSVTASGFAFPCLTCFALCMFCRQPGRSMGIRSSMGIRMSRDTSMSRGTSTSR